MGEDAEHALDVVQRLGARRKGHAPDRRPGRDRPSEARLESRSAQWPGNSGLNRPVRPRVPGNCDDLGSEAERAGMVVTILSWLRRGGRGRRAG
jgi:hypothetical protein